MSDKAILSKVCSAIATRNTGRLRLFNRTPPAWRVYHGFSTSSHDDNNINNKQSRPDPFARRPNQKCDPYGQGGKPLTAVQAEHLLPTLHSDWVLQGVGYQERRHPHHPQQKSNPTSTSQELSNSSSRDTDDIETNSADGIPTLLRRSFVHPDFLSGASLLNHMAAVAQMNDHYPSLSLERQLDSRKKQWTVQSTITFHTFVLQGLSHHDFFVATVRPLSLTVTVRGFCFGA